MKARSLAACLFRRETEVGQAAKPADPLENNLTGRAAHRDDPEVRACVAELAAYRVRGAQHRRMPQFRNSDDKIGPAVAGPPAIQFTICDGAAPKQFRQT